MERNVERIKNLENELGRYKKKVGDQQREIQALHEQLAASTMGAQEIQRAVDATLAAVALEYGVDAEDPDRPGKVLGKRLEIHRVNVDTILLEYEVHARRDEQTGMYVVGVSARADGGSA